MKSVYCPNCDAQHSVPEHFVGGSGDFCLLEIQPRKAGIARSKDGETSQRWAIFQREEVESLYGEVSAENALEIAAGLTGWSQTYRGPGRAFTSDPIIFVYKRNILVRQFCGLDI